MSYYIYVNEQPAGPYPMDQIQQMVNTSQITPETPCCREGDSAWLTVGHFLQKGSTVTLPSDRFGHPTYLVRTQLFKLFGAGFEIYGPNKELLFYSELKAFKLKEDIRLYTTKEKTEELLTIKARQIIDFSATYDVCDSGTQAKIGALRRKGLRSMFRDEWVILDAQDQEIGLIQEDSMMMALIRRFLTNLIPQSFHGTVGGAEVFHFKQNFNPFLLKLSLDFSIDTQGKLDRRLGLAAAILLCSIEGRQQGD